MRAKVESCKILRQKNKASELRDEWLNEKATWLNYKQLVICKFCNHDLKIAFAIRRELCLTFSSISVIL